MPSVFLKGDWMSWTLQVESSCQQQSKSTYYYCIALGVSLSSAGEPATGVISVSKYCHCLLSRYNSIQGMFLWCCNIVSISNFLLMLQHLTLCNTLFKKIFFFCLYQQVVLLFTFPYSDLFNCSPFSFSTVSASYFPTVLNTALLLWNCQVTYANQNQQAITSNV